MAKRNKYYDLSKIKNTKHVRVKKKFTLDTFIATFFFIGYIPIAPGTFGSLAAYPIYNYLLNHNNKEGFIFWMWAIVIFLTIIGTWAIRKYQSRTMTFDHKSVVIDEVIGMLITLAVSFTWLYAIADFLLVFLDMKIRNIMFLVAFVAFRYCDITKPLFIGVVDRYYKKPFGVILDDILAGLLASGGIYIIFKIIEFLN